MSNIVKFWQEQARHHKGAPQATSPDHFYRDLEIRQILPYLTGYRDILDVGCGNGYSTAKFADHHPHAHVLGIDISEEMVKSAWEHHSRDNTSYEVCDVRDASFYCHEFDCVVSERCLINLETWNEQAKAIIELKGCLTTGGRLIIVENIKEGLHNLNRLRKRFDLPEIKERWHNRYMTLAELMPLLELHFDNIHVRNIGNLYYILSRVVYAALCQKEGKEPEYDNPINEIASQLPPLDDHFYSPNYMFICDQP